MRSYGKKDIQIGYLSFKRELNQQIYMHKWNFKSSLFGHLTYIYVFLIRTDKGIPLHLNTDQANKYFSTIYSSLIDCKLNIYLIFCFVRITSQLLFCTVLWWLPRNFLPAVQNLKRCYTSRKRIFIISDYRLLETNVIDIKLYLGKAHLLISASSIAVTTDPCYSQLVLQASVFKI